ncbi:glycosyltransferase [Marinilongibacter aquaticus]|uniref:glycosyltransferase n=1 Tax=Marinilongibacter aquaticus TaxID=2975157 RepID=UPI0021BD4E30|nr:glycosyltransferase [Marinilongibacter aquaticus]UBM59520.1 glycosyltransferase [Marinilongibacter aquaticus]
MRILIVNTGHIPVTLYGGTERVIWGLGKELAQRGHELTFLVKQGSSCDFAKVIAIDENKDIVEQIGPDYDVVHFNFRPKGLEKLQIPYIITMHGNSNTLDELDKNTVFVSQNHASRYNSDSFVHNGLDWSEYASPELHKDRKYFHFLGKAAWRVKNVQGAIDTIKKTPSEKLKVLGGVRFNFKMGIRFTFSPRVSFAGMVGGQEKYDLINGSKGLIFPVKWHEPFGLAIVESLFYGCPVFGTPYGSLPELITEDVGYLSNRADELAEALSACDNYSRKRCHEYVREEFNNKKMTSAYLKKYEKVISGETLHTQAPRLINLQEGKWLEWH